jgi:hypothetical protein
MSLSEKAKTGLREMPSNAAWLVSRALQPAESVGAAADNARAGARDRRRRMSAAVVDAMPVGGDSVELRLKRARDAADRAREAEERAIEAAEEAKERSDHAREVSERGRARVEDVERATSREVKQRVAEAQKAAEEAVARERREAEADAQRERQETTAEVDEEIGEAQGEAEEAQRRAQELVDDATEKLAEARRLADEGAKAARAAAEEAQRQAQELAEEAEQQAGDAEARVSAAERLRERAKATGRETARALERNPSNGDLKAYNKPELLQLAAGIGIEGRTTMTKDELVDAIAKASRGKR